MRISTQPEAEANEVLVNNFCTTTGDRESATLESVDARLRFCFL
jgi:hypothetical protein